MDVANPGGRRYAISCRRPPADEVMENLTTAQQAGQAFKAVQWGTPDDIDAARQRLTAGMGPGSTQVKKGGEGGVGVEQPGEEVGTEAYRIRQRILAKFDEKVAARNAALKADPAAFVGTAPTVAAAAQALNAPNLTDQQKSDATGAYFSAVAAAQTHLGVPDENQHLLSAQQASRIASKLNTADPSQVDVGKQIDQMSARLRRQLEQGVRRSRPDRQAESGIPDSLDDRGPFYAQ